MALPLGGMNGLVGIGAVRGLRLQTFEVSSKREETVVAKHPMADG